MKKLSEAPWKVISSIGISVALLLLYQALPISGKGRPWPSPENLTSLITLTVLLYYAWDTHKIAVLQSQEIGLKKQPIVVFTVAVGNTAPYMPRVIGQNASNVHAVVAVRATLTWDGKSVDLSSNEHYNGKGLWQLQAGTGINGHLTLDRPASTPDKARLLLQSYVVNFDDRMISEKMTRNPDVLYDFHDGHWVPEVAAGMADWPELEECKWEWAKQYNS